MTRVINLNQARKAKARADAKTVAAQNRVKFGRGNAQKDQERAAALKAQRSLDQAKRET